MSMALGENGDAREDPTEQRASEGPRGGARTWYEVLDVRNDATYEEICRAYERSLSLVEGRSIGGYLMLDPLAAESARVDVEAAFRVLSDPEKRAHYDQSLEVTAIPSPSPIAARERADAKRVDDSDATAPTRKASDEPPARASEAPAPSTAPEATERSVRILSPVSEESGARAPSPGVALRFEEPTAVDDGDATPSAASDAAAARPAVQNAAPTPPAGSPPPPASTPVQLPDGEIDGDAVRRLREARGLTLDALADATKIRRQYLRAIEEQDLPNLPGRVFLRGFLTQIGRVLKVDRQRLADGYLAFVVRLGLPETSPPRD